MPHSAASAWMHPTTTKPRARPHHREAARGGHPKKETLPPAMQQGYFHLPTFCSCGYKCNFRIKNPHRHL
jgi:hypothetical protein